MEEVQRFYRFSIFRGIGKGKGKFFYLQGKPEITKQDTHEVLQRVGKVKWVWLTSYNFQRKRYAAVLLNWVYIWK